MSLKKVAERTMISTKPANICIYSNICNLIITRNQPESTIESCCRVVLNDPLTRTVDDGRCTAPKQTIVDSYAPFLCIRGLGFSISRFILVATSSGISSSTTFYVSLLRAYLSHKPIYNIGQ